MRLEKRVSGLSVFMKTAIPILIIWIIFGLQYYGVLNGDCYAISINNGIFSILTGPLFHADLEHIISNTIPMLLCLPIIARYYREHYSTIMELGFLFPSILIFVNGSSAIGISGLCYALVFFTMVAGIFSEDRTRFLMGAMLVLFYGTLIKGATPLASFGVSWVGHLVGLIVGAVMGILSIKIKPKTRKYEE